MQVDPVLTDEVSYSTELPTDERVETERPVADVQTASATENETSLPIQQATRPLEDAVSYDAMGRKGEGAGGGGVYESKKNRPLNNSGANYPGVASRDSVDGLVGSNRAKTTKGTGYGGGRFGGRSVRGPSTQPQQNRFVDHGLNTTTLVSKDNLSTFAADVDTASYTHARSLLNANQMPPQAAVRVEEFVNFFPYPTPAPAPGHVFAVRAESAPSPWTENHTLLRIGVNTASPDASERKPVALTFLVDVSGSMNSTRKLPLAIQSIRTMLGHLGEEDTVAIVTYAGNTRVVLRPTSASNTRVLAQALNELNSSGSTAMGAGIDLAYGLADESYKRGIENRVIILSDGDANVGQSSIEGLLTKIQRYAGRGITLSTIGFGQGNYRGSLMEQLANKGDGNSFYIDNQREANRIFGTRLLSTLQTVARDVKFQVDFNPEAVHSYRLVGYENRDIADSDFRVDAVDAGEIGMGHAVTALYDLVLTDRPTGDLATVRIRHKTPGEDVAATEIAYRVPKSMMRDSLASTSASYRIALGAATFAELMRGSPYVNEIDYADVDKLVAGALRVGVPEDKELLALIRKADSLSGPLSSR